MIEMQVGTTQEDSSMESVMCISRSINNAITDAYMALSRLSCNNKTEQLAHLKEKIIPLLLNVADEISNLNKSMFDIPVKEEATEKKVCPECWVELEDWATQCPECETVLDTNN